MVCSRAISPCYRPAPQDAGFHFVQAYCLCLFRHPLKGVCITRHP
ncbi:PTS cellbiose transporter subunit IIC [Ruminococcus bromii]|nr:PTS cellbiose transporter subunit IIC [Ruminococcus sp. AF17-11]RGH84729.1 PTS cellbiose transporter subunit IIC [Ruminococcus sp. AM28-29LB]RGU81897.1 PTS cellbiose transporter subunit IIC [Ruminococcus bromii]RGY67565.1 PTS cellbiose transporter subunit IIC [Ruminococcus bromii]RGZ98335.1 PTS cellbiose transporter subunit IIC [Ruminococcus bromii]